jgi:hypothetical protein
MPLVEAQDGMAMAIFGSTHGLAVSQHGDLFLVETQDL